MDRPCGILNVRKCKLDPITGSTHKDKSFVRTTEITICVTCLLNKVASCDVYRRYKYKKPSLFIHSHPFLSMENSFKLFLTILIILTMKPTKGTECTFNHFENSCTFSSVTTTKSSPSFQPTSAHRSTAVTVSVVQSSIHILTNDICNNFPKIEALKIDRSNLKYIAKDALTNCVRLKIISFYTNLLVQVDKVTFAGNPELTAIYFQRNQFRNIDMKMFSSLQKLEILNLSNNFLVFIDFMQIAVLPKVHTLELYGNNMVRIDETEMVKKFPSLKEVNLERNVFDCNRMEEITATLNSSGIKVESFDEKTPPRECYNATTYKEELGILLLEKNHEATETTILSEEFNHLIEQLLNKVDKRYLFIPGVFCIVLLATVIGLVIYLRKLKRKKMTLVGPLRDYYYCETTAEDLNNRP